MKDLIWPIIWIVVVGAALAWFWRAGQLARLAAYVQETREELKKCTWPSWEELKGSTAVVSLSVLLLGLFTVAADFVFNLLVRWLT